MLVAVHWCVQPNKRSSVSLGFYCQQLPWQLFVFSDFSCFCVTCWFSWRTGEEKWTTETFIEKWTTVHLSCKGLQSARKTINYWVVILIVWKNWISLNWMCAQTTNNQFFLHDFNNNHATEIVVKMFCSMGFLQTSVMQSPAKQISQKNINNLTCS